MTTVADKKTKGRKISNDNLADASRVHHDVAERLLKGSLGPRDYILVMSILSSKGIRAANLIAYAKENCPAINWTDPAKPKARRACKSTTMFNEAEFFQMNESLWVASDLVKYVGLQTRLTRLASALKGRTLTSNESEAQIFGNPGSKLYQKTLAEGVVDLGQIAQLIQAQPGGREGKLLNNGYATTFPVRGGDGMLHVVNVYWHAGSGLWNVYCDPFDAGNVWRSGCQVFSN